MKKIFLLAAIFILVFAACEDPNENTAPKLPNLTIRNESSFVLTDVKFSGISFASTGSDLNVSSQAVNKLAKNDLNKAGYITFVRKDIGIILRTEAISIGDSDFTFTFLDTTLVEEQGNSSNRRALSQISFLSQVTVERSGLTVAKNDNVNLGESLLNILKQNDFTLKNTGVGKLLFDGTEPIKITNDADSVFSIVQPASSEIAPNGSLPFRINFTPKNIQAYSATVTIKSNDLNGDFAFSISATGVPPKPVASILYGVTEISQNGTINAGEVLITQSKNITVTIKNSGTALLTLDTADITISGTDASAFTKLGNPSSNISVGNSSTFDIKCEPIKEGENNATLRIPTNDDARSTIEVYLRVIGVRGAPVMELSQGTTVIQNHSFTPFDFGKVRVNETKTLSFTVKNTGNIPLVLNGDPTVVSSNAVFTVTNQPPVSSRTLQPNATVNFILQYQPTIEGKQTSEITIMNNSDAALFAFTIEGTGTVPRPLAKIYYNATEIHQDGIIDAGEVLLTQSKTISVTIKNDGDATMTVDTANIEITGPEAQNFTRTTTPAGTILEGAQASFNIQCTPNKQGEHNATLTIPTNDISRNPVVVNLKMTGVQGAPILELSQGSTVLANNSITPFNFGRVDIGSNENITFTIKNTGNIALVLSGTPVVESSNASFTIPSLPTSTTINPGSTVIFAVRYTPTAEQEETGFISIMNNSNTMVFTLNVKGNGYIKKPQITVQQGSSPVHFQGEYDFGSVAINESKEVTFAIGNSGDANLSFVSVNGNSVNLDNNTDSLFTVMQQPLVSSTVVPGNSANFVIRFRPIAEVNNLSAVVLIKTNSRANEDFLFIIKGNGYVKKPQITISQGDISVNQYGEFDFGTIPPSETKNLSFTINNSGEANLVFVTVDGNRVNLLEDNEKAFSVVQQPSAGMILPPGNTAAFILRFSPTTENIDYVANVQIESNSETNSVFSFWVKGKCEQRVYKIGDTGPAGGIIFYDAGSVINGWRYLEASLNDFSAQWGPSNTTVGNTGLSIGDGKQNTQRIVARLNQIGQTGRAAQLCANLDYNGYKDWFLPSMEELNEMYKSRTLLNMSVLIYWSSSESSSLPDYHAWIRNFSSSSITYYYYFLSYGSYSTRDAILSGGASTEAAKIHNSNNFRVRPIRSF